MLSMRLFHLNGNYMLNKSDNKILNSCVDDLFLSHDKSNIRKGIYYQRRYKMRLKEIKTL